ncbi:MAG: hypothetical protein GXP32_01595, partial [Kiritimatiellaeota bacterium]|nr:hypothetical protein [Kiritimatiellota bacterium]
GAASKSMKLLRVPLSPGAIGKVDLELFFEKNIRGTASLDIPVLRVLKAKSVRGYLLLAASRGLSLAGSGTVELKKVHPGSVPFKIPGLLLSYKFKGQKWSGKVDITHEKTSFVSEIFHLSTVGEGAVYGLSFFNYRISGAPTDKLVVALRKGMNNPEFTGADIVDWRKIKENESHQFWRVNFKEKLFGDYKLLVTYESSLLSDKKTAVLRFGDIFTENAAAESGFIVVASKENLKITEKKLSSASIMELEASELPREYASLVQNPIIKAYKFYQSPHWFDAEIAEFSREKLVGTVIDYARLDTRVALNGELVTKVDCRLKNALRQFISMKLPKNAELWNVSVDGVRKRVSKSASEGKEVYLIPIPRKKDTEEPIALSISYARKLDAPLGAGISMRLMAPEFDVDALSLKWRVTVPENYDFTSIDGNLMTRQAPRLSGFSGMFSNMALWWSNWTRTGVPSGFIMVLIGSLLLAYAWGRGKLRILLSVVATVGILVGVAWLLGSLSRHGIQAPAVSTLNSVVFTKMFATGANTPAINITVEDMEASTFMKFFWFIVIMAPALYLLRMGFKRKSAFFFAAATTFALFALSRWLPASRLLAIALATLIPLAFAVFSVLLVFKKSKAARIAAAAALPLLLFCSTSVMAGEQRVLIDDAVYAVSASNVEVKAVASFTVSAKAPGEVLLVPAPAGITGELPENDDIRLERKGGDYYLKLLSAGEWKFKLTLLLPLKKDKDGAFSFPLPLANSRKNSVEVTVNIENTDISAAEAVFFKTSPAGGKLTARASFVPGTKPVFRLFPLKRKVGSESVRFFVDTSSLANFAGGVVEIKHLLDFNIAQGELAKFAVEIPPPMKVTAVSAPDLGAWRYSAKTNELEVFLTQPHHDKLKMVVTTQIPDCVLPYERKLQVLKVTGAEKQHGSFGISVSPGVRIEVAGTEGMSPINSSDFTARGNLGSPKMRKAYRYFNSEAFARVKAFPVNPEIRISEKCVVGFDEEKTTLVSDMALEVSKAGVFDISVEIPKGFDVDKVTGDSVRHWDDIKKDGKRLVVVHFAKRVLGATLLHMELMSEKPRTATLVVPRLHVLEARKLKGALTINLERGTRMDIREKRGLESAPLPMSGAKSSRRFSIVRLDWMLKIDLEVASPWVQLDNLQICGISDGALEFKSIFRYKIENAGVKRFRLRLPAAAEVPEFIGRDVMSYVKLDSGVWEVELQRKVLGSYKLEVKFRTPVKDMGKVAIRPVEVLGIDIQKGYFAIVAEDSLRVKCLRTQGDLSKFDARKIPGKFNSKYLADTVFCYRTVGTDYSVEVSVGRDKAVKLLRAEIRNLTLTSLVSLEGNIITRTLVDLVNVGSEHFLALKLPPNSRLWSVFIDRTDSLSNPGQPVEAARENGRILIPLKQKSDKPQKIELVYSTKPDMNWRLARQAYAGPEFELPLNNISWTLYLPEKMEYYDFSGTLKYKERRWIPTPEMNLSEYDRVNSEKKWRKKRMVKQWLSKAASSAASGNIQEANAAFQNASDFALDDNELREDVQGEWREAQSLNVLNLFQKRSRRQVKGGAALNSGGARTNKYDLSQVSGKEMRTVKSISNKMFKQQLAAVSSAKPLVFSLPENGRKVEFTRPLQVSGDTPMRVSFSVKTVENRKSGSGPITAFLALTALLFLIYKFAAVLAGKPTR